MEDKNGGSGVGRLRFKNQDTCAGFDRKRKHDLLSMGSDKQKQKQKKKKKDKKKRKHKHKRRSKSEDSSNSSAEDGKGPGPNLVEIDGTGTLISSGLALTGTGTRFLQELKHGDAIIVQHPVSGRKESRMVSMVLSDTSASVRTPFSSDVEVETGFRFMSKPRDIGAEERKKRKKETEKSESLKSAFGTFADTDKTFTYRKKLENGNYKIVTETVDTELSRTELLELRCQKGGDRKCM